MSVIAIQPATAIETLVASPVRDNKLLFIEQYLTNRLPEVLACSSAPLRTRILIDINILGTGPIDPSRIERWKEYDLVCALRLDRASIILGPLYTPRSTEGPCPACLERRWFALLVEDEEQFEHALSISVLQENSWITPFALEKLVYLTASYVMGEQPHRVYALSLETLATTSHLLLADSLCPVCTASSKLKDSPELASIELTPRPKPDVSADRLVNASDYPLPLEGYVNQICGMLGAERRTWFVNPVTTCMQGSFTAILPFTLKREIHWVGLGRTYGESRRLGILEGLERHASFWPRSRETCVFDSYRNLQHVALNLETCSFYQPAYYERADSLCIPFDPDLVIPWVWGYSFRQRRPLLVPETYIYYTGHRPGYPTFVRETSSGCASGSSLEEAIFFAIMELVERDGFLLAWYTKTSPRRIDPWSCHSRHIYHLLSRLERIGYDVHLLDMRFDIPFPSITVMLASHDQAAYRILVGARASFDPEKAICAALNEAGNKAFALAVRVQENRDALHEMVRDFSKIQSPEDHASLYGLPEMARKASFLSQNPDIRPLDERYAVWQQERPRTFDLRDDLLYCIQTLLDRGLDVVVVDQTSPEQARVGLKTVKAIVPGLLPIDFGGGKIRGLDLPRLRTAMRVAGYRDGDFDPANYNTDPHPFP